MIENRFVTKFLASFWAVSLILFLSSSAYAFPYRGVDINIQTSVTETYNDNLTFAKKDKKADFVTALGLNLGVKYEGKRRSLALNSRINERFHSRYSEIKSSSESVSLNFVNKFSEYDRIRVTDTFSHSRSPAGFEEEFGRVRARRETYKNTFNLRYEGVISKYFRINSFYGNIHNNFPDTERDDTSQNRFGVRLSYLPGPSTAFSLLYTYARNNFERTSQTTAFGIKRYIIKKIFLNGEIGATKNSIGDDNKRKRLHVKVSLTDEIDENSVAKILFSRSQRFVSEGGDIFTNWKITARITKQLSQRMASSFSAFYGRGTFSSTDITNRLTGADASLSYAFLEDFTGEFRYAYSNYDSTQKNYGYIRNTVSISLNKTF